MAKQELKVNDKIHGVGEQVNTLDIVLKGSVSMSVPGKSTPVTLKVGSIIGLGETPGGKYYYQYVAATDCVIYSYDFKEESDLDKVIQANQKIAPVMVSAAVRTSYDLKTYATPLVEQASAHRKKLLDDYKDYPILCNAMGKVPIQFPFMKDLKEPAENSKLLPWQVGLINGFYKNDEKFNKEIYPLGPDLCIGIVYVAREYMRKIMQMMIEAKDYIAEIDEQTAEFQRVYSDLKMQESDRARANSAVMADGAVPTVKNAPETIMSYARMDKRFRDSMTELMESYVNLPDRSSTEEDVRKLRRKITDGFYKIYSKAVLRYLNERMKNAPLEVELFLKFGFFDERVVEAEDFANLYRLHVTYIPDPRHKVVTVPEWLSLVYDGEVMPSKNEFDLDYPSYLREEKQSGNISEDDMEWLMDNMEERVNFEVKNLVTLGNRMTFGRISVFIPIFDSVNQMTPLDRCYSSQEKVNEELNKIRGLDFECFYREYVFQDDEIGVPPITLHKEYTPYFILMPNIGSRSVLWQEIEGKKRTTSARMLMPIFSLEDFTLAMTRMCGEFRWEMCKTEQGVHWNDISDPSLTSEYSDFLQYYRKNSALNPEQKEKVKKALQKAGNNYRKVFVSDYVMYIMYEAAGSLRMSKVSREILYKYCPLAKDVGEKLISNGQYSELVRRRQNKSAQNARTIENYVKKREFDGQEVPDELRQEVEFLKG